MNIHITPAMNMLKRLWYRLVGQTVYVSNMEGRWIAIPYVKEIERFTSPNPLLPGYLRFHRTFWCSAISLDANRVRSICSQRPPSTIPDEQ